MKRRRFLAKTIASIAGLLLLGRNISEPSPAKAATSIPTLRTPVIWLGRARSTEQEREYNAWLSAVISAARRTSSSSGWFYLPMIDRSSPPTAAPKKHLISLFFDPDHNACWVKPMGWTYGLLTDDRLWIDVNASGFYTGL